MPRGDGTGPFGQRSGKGMCRGGMVGNRRGGGPGGVCICPSCGTKVPHQAGVPCTTVNCPNCGTRMIRG